MIYIPFIMLSILLNKSKAILDSAHFIITFAKWKILQH